jgi:hypothetical protein
MKRLIFLIFAVFLTVPLIVLANGENKRMIAPSATQIHSQMYSQQLYAQRYSQVHAYSLVTVTLIPGSLKANIERIARENGWSKVVWNPDEDYTWVTYTKISKPSFAAIMQTILANYPLQAVFYQGNKVLLIQPRTMR